MAHYATSLTGSTSTTWSSLLLDWVQEKTALETGWSVVKHNVLVGSDYLTVIKCANGPVEFFVGFVRYTTSPSEIAIILAEGFNSTTNVFTKPASVTTVATGFSAINTATAADGSVGATTYSHTDVVNTFSAGRFRAGSAAYPQMNRTWDMSIFSDGIWLMGTQSTGGANSGKLWAYMGFIDSLVTDAATNDPVPLVILNYDLNYTTSSDIRSRGGSTRSAMNFSASAHDWHLWHSPWLNEVFGNRSDGSSVSSTATFDKYAGTSKPYASPAFIRRRDFTNASDRGYLRGETDRIVYAWGGTVGDTLTIGSDEYVKALDVWLKKAV